MANIKSAMKRIRTSEKRRVRNAAVRSTVRTSVKGARDRDRGGPGRSGPGDPPPHDPGPRQGGHEGRHSQEHGGPQEVPPDAPAERPREPLARQVGDQAGQERAGVPRPRLEGLVHLEALPGGARQAPDPDGPGARGQALDGEVRPAPLERAGRLAEVRARHRRREHAPEVAEISHDPREQDERLVPRSEELRTPAAGRRPGVPPRAPASAPSTGGPGSLPPGLSRPPRTRGGRRRRRGTAFSSSAASRDRSSPTRSTSAWAASGARSSPAARARSRTQPTTARPAGARTSTWSLSGRTRRPAVRRSAPAATSRTVVPSAGHPTGRAPGFGQRVAETVGRLRRELRHPAHEDEAAARRRARATRRRRRAPPG